MQLEGDVVDSRESIACLQDETVEEIGEDLVVVGIAGETWVQITIRDRNIEVKAYNGPPNCSR